jgi:hypothetical protein
MGSGVDGQRQAREDRVGLVRAAEVGRRDPLELGADELFGVHRVVLMDTDVLRDPREVGVVVQRVAVLAGPPGRDLGSQRQHPGGSPRTEKRGARAARDPPQQQLPVRLQHEQALVFAEARLYAGRRRGSIAVGG